MSVIIESIVNVSEGRNVNIIQEIALAIKSTPNVALLHIDSNYSANRTVFTFAGAPVPVIDACYALFKTALRLIDMRYQTGAHPRIGAVDVCPFVALKGISIEELVVLTNHLASKISNDFGVPIYLYEYSAKMPYRKSLSALRKGGYENSWNKIQQPEWSPDFRGVLANTSCSSTEQQEAIQRTGISVLGVRDILVAFNISLHTKDATIAQAIAQRMRSIGYNRQKGLLPKLRAIGWYIEEFDAAQISMNLLDYRITSPLKVWETCNQLAEEYHVKVKGCELIGLIPEICILEAGQHVLPHASKEAQIHAGVDYLKLNCESPFVPEERILEYALTRAGISGLNGLF